MFPVRTISVLAAVLGLAALPADLLSNKVPDSLELSDFCDPEVTPCPACLAVAPTGEVLVGADEHTDFALVDHPRGLISVGDKPYVLHTTYGDDG